MARACSVLRDLSIGRTAVCIAGGEAGRGEECPAVEDDLRALLNGAATHLDALVDLTAL